MKKNEAVAIIKEIQLENLRGWLQQAVACGRIYYLRESSKGGARHRIQLATIDTRHDTPGLNHLWPCATPQYTTDDPGVNARSLVGGYSAAQDVAAESLGFSYKTRTFVRNGGGMDMVWDLIHSLAERAGVDVSSVDRVNMDRT